MNLNHPKRGFYQVKGHEGRASLCFRGQHYLALTNIMRASYRRIRDLLYYLPILVWITHSADFRPWPPGGGCASLEARGLNLSLFVITFEAPTHHPRVYSQLTYQQLPSLDIPRLRGILAKLASESLLSDSRRGVWPSLCVRFLAT
eukprot:scaffold3048_cov417-Prasinococcus_capsulatus_cf.AAC.2